MLHAAARGDLPTAMQGFLANQQGVEVNCVEDEKGLTALHWAAHLGHLECVRVLLADPRVDVNFKSQKGQTALHAAAEEGKDEVVELLLTSDPEAQKPKTFRIASFYAQKFSGRSARIHFSRHVKKARNPLSRLIKSAFSLLLWWLGQCDTKKHMQCSSFTLK